jgi:hypothetical protein
MKRVLIWAYVVAGFNAGSAAQAADEPLVLGLKGQAEGTCIAMHRNASRLATEGSRKKRHALQRPQLPRERMT